MSYSLKAELEKERSLLRTNFRIAESQKGRLDLVLDLKTVAKLDAAAAAAGLNRSAVVELLCRNSHRFVFMTAAKAGEMFAGEDQVISVLAKPASGRKSVTVAVTKTAKMIVDARTRELEMTNSQFIEAVASGLPRLSLADLVSCDPLDHPDIAENTVQEEEDDTETTV